MHSFWPQAPFLRSFLTPVLGISILGLWLLGVSLPARASNPMNADVLEHPSDLDTPSDLDALSSASTGGIRAVDRALARLSSHRRLLMIAAHPDDEDTFVLAHVASLGGEAAYLSLSRGDGGQNLIGSELGEGLGLLRSRELESARRVDGARQYFSRAFDFGYTRSLEETFERWPRDILMQDTRNVFRRFKPQVVVAVFPPDARAGHGQHQASAVVAEQLFQEMSGDPSLPWRADSFYRASWWNPTAATLELDLGRVDPITGRSTFQTALESRSQHRCQDMGFEQPPGDAVAGLIWQGGISGKAPDDLFGESDTRLAAIAAPLLESPGGRELGLEVEKGLERVSTVAVEARSSLVAARLETAVPALVEIVGILSRLRDHTAIGGDSGDADLDERRRMVHELVTEKLAVARRGLSAAAGFVVDAVTDRDRLVPGETIEVRSLFWSSGGFEVEDLEIELAESEPLGSGGWKIVSSRPAEPARGRFRVEVTDESILTVQAPETAELSVPYFLRRPRDGDLYRWADDQPGLHTRPFGPPTLSLRFRGVLEGVPMEWHREVVFRYRDQALGEVRRPLQVVPPLEISLDRELVVRPVVAGRTVDDILLKVDLIRHQESGMSGHLVVETPPGWSAPAPVPFELNGPRGQRQGLEIRVQPPSDLAPGTYPLSISVDGSEGRSLQRIEYEHIRPTALPRTARVTVRAAPIRLPELRRVAYVRGASDRVPEMLLEIGLPLELVTAEQLLLEDLGRFDAVVIGSRAFEIEPTLAKANDRLLEFARSGGTVLVQYQQYQFVQGGFAPFELDIRRPHDRVTDETAEVRLLDAGHPLLRTPNAISEADWQGWVQERGLYFAGTWGAEWIPLLAMSDPIGDPGGEEKQGALLVAELGEGRYIYTGLAFFRQLPAGVPGAYRLFVNLLSRRSGA